MKKVVLAAFLACVVVVSGLPLASAQDASSGAQAPAGGGVQMAADEYAMYNNAWTMPQANPTEAAAKAAALEAYLAKYPQSAVKQAVLQTILALTFPAPSALDTADKILQIDPNDIKALYAETVLHRNAAEALTDPAAKQAALDTAASFAQKGLAAPKPAGMSDADFTTLKNSFYPSFYSAIGYAAFMKKDSAAAIDAYKKELAFVPLDQTKTPGPVLLDTFYLAEAYYQSTPPDYLDCAFYATRAVAYAPDAFKTQASPTAKYCYHKYHGPNDDQYDQLTTIATANLNPPADLGTAIKPAPTPADIVNQVLATTPDLTALAPGDKEYILANGTPDQAAKMWDAIKGKSYQFPNVLVIASSPTQVQVAISEDAVQSKTADFTFNMTPPEPVPDLPEHATPAEKLRHKREEEAAQKKADAIAAATAVGQTVTLSGTFDSYTPKPIMITMSDGAVILPEAPKPVVHHTAPKRQQ